MNKIAALKARLTNVLTTAHPSADFEARTNIALFVQGSYRYQFEEYTQWWRDLVAKAQGMIVATGVLLSGGAVFSAELKPSNELESLLLLAIFGFMVSSIVASFRALYVSDLSSSPEASDIHESAIHLLSQRNEMQKDGVRLLVDEFGPVWKNAIQDIYEDCLNKSKHLKRAQENFIFALALVTVFALVRYLQ